jgi:FKBP-type peptidyl-prolyl cis-trans isomerase (trigger factor)
MMYGMSYEEILKMIGMTDDDIYNRAHDNVLTDMIVYSVIKAENFSITAEEYDELLAELAESSGYSKDKILETYTEEKLNDMFTYTKIYEKAATWQKYTVVERTEG